MSKQILEEINTIYNILTKKEIINKIKFDNLDDPYVLKQSHIILKNFLENENTNVKKDVLLTYTNAFCNGIIFYYKQNVFEFGDVPILYNKIAAIKKYFSELDLTSKVELDPVLEDI